MHHRRFLPAALICCCLIASGGELLAGTVTYLIAGDISIVQQQTLVFPFGPHTTFTGSVSYNDSGPFQSINVLSNGVDYHNGIGIPQAYSDIVINLVLLDNDTHVTHAYSRSYHVPAIAVGSASYAIGDVQILQIQSPQSFDLFAVSLDTSGSRNDLPSHPVNQAQESIGLAFRGSRGMVSSTNLSGLALDWGKISSVTIDYSLHTTIPGGVGGIPLGTDSFRGVVTSFSLAPVPEPSTVVMACAGLIVGFLARRFS